MPRTFTVFVDPVNFRNRRIHVEEGFLAARAYKREHPEMVEHEVEAETPVEALNEIIQIEAAVTGTFHSFLFPHDDDKARLTEISTYGV